jgi:hypothetical protein
MQQLHDREVMAAKDPKDLTPEQRQEALAYLMFLKRKRCGTIKGRGCADGRKQRAYTAKEEATSPTIATEAVFLTAVIAALEGRDVAIVDVPGAFMQTDLDELVHVRFTGTMVDLLLEIDHEMYSPFITYEGKSKVLYVELLKALYGTLRAARLFWEKLSGKLVDWGFTLNPYDSCVANKIVNGKQCTVGWHVDDATISHLEPEVVDVIIGLMNDEFGKEAPLTISRGRIHDYLGMTFDFSEDGVVAVDMIDYVKSVIAEMPAEMIGTAATPAADHLFTVNEEPILLDKTRSDTYHKLVMQLQYMSQRARPDLRTAVSFMCKRVNKPDEDDWKKLTRTMRYLQSTVSLKLRLSADGSGNVAWYIDASHGVHFDMKGHSGGTMTMGKGSIYSTANGQKLVARSSTESELIAFYDVMPQVLWTDHFLTAQGHIVKDNIVYQDNKSSILLEKNGRASSSKRTRHINIRYFFVKDHVDRGTIRIEHCPTKEMIADYFTKPLQGVLFYQMRDHIMNIDPSSPYHSGHRSVLENDHPDVTNVLENDHPDVLNHVPTKVPEAMTIVTPNNRRSYRDVLVQN